MRVRVIEPYQRPFNDPLVVGTGEPVEPDFDRPTDIEGWVWCIAGDGRAGWTPRGWLVEAADGWHVDRPYSAVELTVAAGEVLDVEYEESGFYWVTSEDGRAGWVPCRNVTAIA